MGNTDLIGQRFGMLTVLGDSGERRAGSVLWRCRCDCGGEILLIRRELTGGYAANCGCVPRMRKPHGEAEDLTGQRFGRLTVLGRTENVRNNRTLWRCRCDCGRECQVLALRLKTGRTQSCGCKKHDPSPNLRDLTGQRFGRLVAEYPVRNAAKSNMAVWHCRCDCGGETEVSAASLLRGLTRSCGCLNQEVRSKMHDHLHYQDDTWLERLVRAQKNTEKNKAGFRGLFLTKSGSYRAMTTFRKVHYTLGYYKDFADAVRARLEAEECLHAGYLAACERYRERAEQDPEWARENPFYYEVTRSDGDFHVSTNGT